MRYIPGPQGWKINETKGVHFFGKINKINKSLVRLTKEKREKTQTANVRNVTGAIDTGPMDIKRKIRKYNPELLTQNQQL